MANDKGDNLLEMITQPKLVLDEVDGKDEKKDESEEDDDDDDDDDEKEEKGGKKGKKAKRDAGGDDDKPDLPDGDSRILRKSDESLNTAAGKSGSKKGGRSQKRK